MIATEHSCDEGEMVDRHRNGAHGHHQVGHGSDATAYTVRARELTSKTHGEDDVRVFN